MKFFNEKNKRKVLNFFGFYNLVDEKNFMPLRQKQISSVFELVLDNYDFPAGLTAQEMKEEMAKTIYEKYQVANSAVILNVKLYSLLTELAEEEIQNMHEFVDRRDEKIQESFSEMYKTEMFQRPFRIWGIGTGEKQIKGKKMNKNEKLKLEILKKIKGKKVYISDLAESMNLPPKIIAKAVDELLEENALKEN